MILISLTIFTSLILFFMFKSSVNKWRIEVNHYVLFSIGFIYYMILPILFGELGILKNDPGFENWHYIYGEIRNEHIYIYIIFSVLYYFSFILFSKFGENIKCEILSRKESIKFSTKNIWPIIGIIMIVIAYYLYIFRGNFFKGYTSDIINVAQKGPFISALQVLLAISLITTSLVTKENNDFKFSSMFNLSIFFYLIGSLLVLSLGGRLYFITGIFAVIVYISNRKIDFNIWITSGLFFLIVVIMGLIGVWRASYSNLNLDSILSNLFQEPIYTSYSMVDFLRTEQHRLIEFPRLLLSEFYNLVPTFISPQKLDHILKPIDFGYHIYNPIGAFQAYVSFAINFGLIGSIPIFGVMGLGLGILKGKENAISRTIYSLVSSHLVFTFFRDGFVTSLVKNIFQYSILVPIVICFYIAIINRRSLQK